MNLAVNDEQECMERVTALLSEMDERLAVLAKFDTGDAAFGRELERVRERLAAARERLANALRANGELPADGNRERVDFGALLTRIKAALYDEDAAVVMARELAEPFSELTAAVAQARLADCDAATGAALDAVADELAAARRRVRSYASDSDCNT